MVIAAYALAPLQTSVVETDVHCTEAPVPHEPIWLRSGIVHSLTNDSLVLAIEKRTGETKDSIIVDLSEGVPVVEIRVPSYLNQELRQRLEQGGIVIERALVGQMALSPGMEVDVISKDDQYCRERVTPLRIEYETIIDTEQQE